MTIVKEDIGQSIRNIHPYDGEGELLIMQLNEYGIKAVHCCNIKYENLNGMEVNISNWELQYYEKV